MTKHTGIIILDGPDGSGKSSLAKYLVEKHDATYFHNVKRKDIWLWHTACLRLAVQHSATRLVVVDRLWLSECVYGAVYRGGSKYPIAARMVDRTLRRFGAVNIIAAPPTDYCVEIHQKVRPHRANELDGVRRVADFYLDVAQGNLTRDPQVCYGSYLAHTGGVQPRGWLWYDVTRHQGDRAMHKYAGGILGALSSKRRSLAERDLDPGHWNLSGCPSSQAVLLVGDRLAGTRADNWPFYANELSSLYLSKALNLAKIDEGEIFIVNSITPDEQEAEILSYGRQARRIVALGGTAERELTRLGLPSVKIHHPSYARRFAYGLDKYAADLSAAVRGG